MAKLTMDEINGYANAVTEESEDVHFLVHHKRDDVGVAVGDIPKGQKITGLILEGKTRIAVVATMEIPLGHKVALRDFNPGEVVTKYGEAIGVVVAEIRKGDHVHMHNLKTARW